MKNNDLKFQALYDKEREKVEKRLEESLKNREPKSLYEPSSYILESKGKRLRPLLVLLSAKTVGGKFKDVYNASLAVEMLHNFTLVHDDIMDNADMRRGKPTVHIKYDGNTALLAGDALLSVAYEFLLKDCNGNAKNVLSAFTHGLVEVCEGQSLDKDFETRSEVSIEEYILMISKKTAAMSEMCCKVGAELGGGSKEEIKALAKYGRNIGIAFQIQDDLLDVFASEAEFGKAIGGDLVEGKKTYLLIKALNKAEGSDKNDLLNLVINKGISKSEIPKFRDLYIRLGTVDDAKNEIKNYTEKAIKSLNKLHKKSEREIFYWLSDSLIKRNK